MMDIRFQTAATRADVELAMHARRRLQPRMRHCSDRVDEIEVKVGDARGQRSRHDSHYIRRVKLHGTPAARVVDVGADVYSAIDRDTDRACRLAEEQLRLTGSPQATHTAALAA